MTCRGPTLGDIGSLAATHVTPNVSTHVVPNVRE